MLARASSDFTFLDGERLVRFGEGALAEAPGLLAGRGFDGYALLTTERALATAPALAEGAAAVLYVPAGPVPDAAAAVRGELERRPLVAFGGGRVIDSAKAIAGADELRCAAAPTTLSGAEMTPFHRMPAGVERFRLVRPALVIAVPSLMASAPAPDLAASAMNALAHAIEALYTPMANPVASAAALDAVELIAAGVAADPPLRDQLALAAILAGYASGSAGFAVHHAVCQTIVRTTGSPHAQTNAVMLPHFVRLMETRAPEAITLVAAAAGAGRDTAAAAGRIAQLSAKTGVTRLSVLGVEAGAIEQIVRAALDHPALGNAPDPPAAEELRALLEGAF